MRMRIAAVAVVLALAGLAYYTVFSGPTTVAIKVPAGPAGHNAAPAEPPEGSGREGGESR